MLSQASEAQALATEVKAARQTRDETWEASDEALTDAEATVKATIQVTVSVITQLGKSNPGVGW